MVKFSLGKIKHWLNGSKKIGNISFQNKIVGNYFVLLILPIISYYLILNIFFHEAKTDKILLIKQLNIQATEGIENYLAGVKYLTKQPLYDKDIQQILKSARNNKILKDKNNVNKKSDEMESRFTRNIVIDESKIIDAFTSQTLNFSKFIYSTFIYDIDGKILSYAFSIGDVPTIKSEKDKEWFKNSISSNGLSVVSGSVKISNNNFNKDTYGITVSRAIRDLDGVQVLGVMTITSTDDFISSILTESKSVKGEYLYILDGKGNIVYDIDKKDTTKNIYDIIPEYTSIAKKSKEITEGNIRIKNNDYIVLVSEIKNAKWQLIRIIPQNILYSNAQKTQRRVFFFIIVFIILSLILSVTISFGLTKPIKRLTKTMKLVKSGDFNVRFEVKNNDEIGQLGTSFNNMVIEIEKLIEDICSTNIRKKEAELNALQAQINPHFVYNTLESIRMMAELSDSIDLSDIIFILGKLLRYSINIKKQTVTLGEEIEHLKNYIVLQNMRFKNKFELHLDINEKLYNYRVIKLILQPIVENSIFHTLETIEGKGIIKVNCYVADKSIFVDIEDNGIGMTEDELKKLNRNTNDFMTVQDSSRGIGLRNVNERIKLCFGEIYGITIFSNLESGTLVRLQLPYKELI